MKQSPLLVVVALCALSFAALRTSAGCAAQGEGELCSTLNNTSDDCAFGLVCVPKYGGGLGACCPPTGSTNPACMGTIGTTTTTTGTGGTTTTTTTTGTGGTGGTTTTTTTTTTGTGGASTTTTTTGTGGSDAGAIGDAGDGGG